MFRSRGCTTTNRSKNRKRGRTEPPFFARRRRRNGFIVAHAQCPYRAILPGLCTTASLRWRRISFGYGSWEAPYWFIGPEQGMGDPSYDSLQVRVQAWRQLGGGELCDCREFHRLIGEQRWHRERRRPLQQTWRPLLLLLATVLNRPTENAALRLYQRDRWGMLVGETCVIELSGLAASSLKVPRDRVSFREDRISVIRERIRQYKPTLVVMYRTRDLPAWEAIAGQPFPRKGILILGPTVLVTTHHPRAHGPTNEYWTRMGRRLRQVIRNRDRAA